VGYSTGKVPINLQYFYALNPVVGVVESFRWATLGTFPSDSLPLSILVAISSSMAVFLLVSGLFYFRRMERTFADMV
jgi:lipopolysaccharide transport system permease protein